MSSGEEREGSHVGSGIPEGRVLPLNARRLVAEYVKAIATSLGLSTRASTDEVRQMVEGKLSESPRNVQVVIQEPEAGTESTNLVHLFLVDEAGAFKEIEAEREHVRREAGRAAAPPPRMRSRTPKPPENKRPGAMSRKSMKRKSSMKYVQNCSRRLRSGNQ